MLTVPRSLLPVLLLLAACSDGPEPSQAAAVRSPSASPSAAVSLAPSPVPVRSAAPSPSPEPVVPSPSGPVAVPAAPGDVDGDGEPDLVTVDEALAVELSGSGRTVTAPLVVDAPPVVRGVEDVDRDGYAEVFVRTGQGASTTFLTPYRFDGGQLAPLRRSGQQLALGVGGSATHGEGFSCTDDGELVVRTATRQDDGTWDVSAVTYALRGLDLEQVDAQQRSAVPEDDPAVGQASVVDCRTVDAG